MMRVLVCGGREYDNWSKMGKALNAIHAKHGISCIIEGGARGADFLAAKWARHNHVPLMRFVAHWNTMGKRAGPVRNGWMLEYGAPDIVVAFPGKDGTANMIQQAKNAGVKVWQPCAPTAHTPQSTPAHSQALTATQGSTPQEQPRRGPRRR